MTLLALVAACGPTTDDATGGRTASGDVSIHGEQRALVEQVTDGDSLRVGLGGDRAEVRLSGVNAPETDECGGAEAADRLLFLIGDAVVLAIVPDERDRDQYGRLLRDVWAGEMWINWVLVSEGFALVLQTGRAGQDELLAAQEAAWRDRLGMWARDACGPSPEGIAIVDVDHDPPGPDEDAVDEELVVLANTGDDAVDLSGWIVRDESTENRYRFAVGTTLMPGAELTLRSGCGDDAGTTAFWCAPGPVWSNAGDTVIVQTPAGTVVDRWVY